MRGPWTSGELKPITHYWSHAELRYASRLYDRKKRRWKCKLAGSAPWISLLKLIGRLKSIYPGTKHISRHIPFGKFHAGLSNLLYLDECRIKAPVTWIHLPGNRYIGHSGEYADWKYHRNGKNISFYDENNFGGYKSYHVLAGTPIFCGYCIGIILGWADMQRTTKKRARRSGSGPFLSKGWFGEIVNRLRWPICRGAIRPLFNQSAEGVRSRRSNTAGFLLPLLILGRILVSRERHRWVCRG